MLVGKLYQYNDRGCRKFIVKEEKVRREKRANQENGRVILIKTRKEEKIYRGKKQ